MWQRCLHCLILSLHWFFLPAYWLLSLDSQAKCITLCHWKGQLRIDLEIICYGRCTRHGSTCTFFYFVSAFRATRFVPSAGASCSSCVTGFSPTVSCVISNVIWWLKSFWYCPYWSCHSVQMCLQISWFPPDFTCEMWPKPRGRAGAEALQHAASFCGSWTWPLSLSSRVRFLPFVGEQIWLSYLCQQSSLISVCKWA